MESYWNNVGEIMLTPITLPLLTIIALILIGFGVGWVLCFEIMFKKFLKAEAMWKESNNLWCELAEKLAEENKELEGR
jgi:hypothetical protein